MQKIDWKLYGKDWGKHLSKRPDNVTLQEWDDKFWGYYGGRDLYFDTDPLTGEKIPRDEIREESLAQGVLCDAGTEVFRKTINNKPVDVPEGATFVPRAVEPDKVIKQYSLNVSRERQSLPLGADAKIVFCAPSQYGEHIAIWVQSQKDDSVLQKPSTIFAIFGDDETIAGGYKHVKSLLKKDRSMIHLCVWKPGESHKNIWSDQEIPD